MEDTPLLRFKNLSLEFDTPEGTVTALDDITFSLYDGEVLGLVGESGAGKSITGRTILALISANGRVTNGSVKYRGSDVLQMEQEEIQRLRGSEIAIISQDPSDSLNPTLTVGKQIKRVIRYGTEEKLNESKREARAIELLDKMGIPAPEDRIDNYPYEFSGGMKQRAMIAMAIANKPSLLVADEPTTALDVTIEAQILKLLQDLQEEYGLSMVFITHDMSVESFIADRLMVMYAGEIAETGPIDEVLAFPQHPYTEALLNSLPTLTTDTIESIPGNMPDIKDKPSGCKFSPRCDYATDICEQENPQLEEISQGNRRLSACHNINEVEGRGVRK